MLGGFKLSLNAAVFSEVQRSTAYSMSAQQRVGNFDALQFIGPGEDRITLPGFVYPDFRRDPGRLEQLREIASARRSLQLVTSTGLILRVWVIESVEETQSAFKPDGGPRKQEFNVRLRKFGDDVQI